MGIRRLVPYFSHVFEDISWLTTYLIQGGVATFMGAGVIIVIVRKYV
jgi:hypothetical protein